MGEAGDGLLHSLKLVAVGHRAQAVIGMAPSLAPTGARDHRDPFADPDGVCADRMGWIAVIVSGRLSALGLPAERGDRRPRRATARSRVDGDRFRRLFLTLSRSPSFRRLGAAVLAAPSGSGALRVRRRACGAAAASRASSIRAGSRQRLSFRVTAPPGVPGLCHVCGLSRRGIAERAAGGVRRAALALVAMFFAPGLCC